MSRAKIVCTMGPSTSSYEVMLSLIRAGMNVARLNMSHGNYADHERTFDLVRRAADELGVGVGILADLQGPKIRLGVFSEDFVQLERDAKFSITTESVNGTVDLASTTYAGLPDDVKVGDRILVDDGKVGLVVESVTGQVVNTRVVDPGPVSDHKGLNLPGVEVGAPALTEKDIEDLKWAIRAGVDLMALSFVRKPSDIDQVHAIMDSEGRRIPVLAKVEKPEAIAALPELVEAFDGIMVARGDLGVELPLEAVPLEQKRAIELCRDAAKPVIVATQMLDSMTTGSRPTRAEVSDVANAILDGAGALMLSGETSIGDDPRLVVDTMSRIISHVEQHALASVPQPTRDEHESTARALTRVAVDVAVAVGAVGVIAFTETGNSAQLLARHRSEIPVIAFTPDEHVRNQLSIVWGVEAFLIDKVVDTDHLVQAVDSALHGVGLGKEGDIVVIIAGVPPGIPGTTNGMRVHSIGDAETAAARVAHLATD